MRTYPHKMRVALLLTVLGSLLLALAAQAQSGAPPNADGLAEGWNRIDVPGAVCAQGDPYAFFARPADPDRLLIYFQGGGACWDRATCGAYGPYDKTVTDVESEVGASGIFDFTDPRNPVAGYTMVVVSYCTGDVHTGSRTETFAGDPPMTIGFHGYDNASAVLDWTFANYPGAQQVFVTGTSAGAYGAAFNAGRIFDAYPAAAQYVLGDAGAGITPEDWLGFDQWGTFDLLPGGQAISGNINSAVYNMVLSDHPEARAAQYTSVADTVQKLFYTLMGGRNQDWTPAMRAEMNTLNQQARYTSYIAPGASHGILPGPIFYDTLADGVNFRDWLANWLAGEPAPAVACADCS